MHGLRLFESTEEAMKWISDLERRQPTPEQVVEELRELIHMRDMRDQYPAWKDDVDNVSALLTQTNRITEHLDNEGDDNAH